MNWKKGRLRYNVRMEILLAAGIGIGLSAVAGLRAYVPLAIVGIFGILGLFGLSGLFKQVDGWVVVGLLVFLALVESGLDKIKSLDPTLDYIQTPVRILAGAVLFAAAVGIGLGVAAIPWLIAGGAIAGVVSVLKVVLRPSMKTPAAGVSVSFLSGAEDLLALIGGVLAVFVPLVPLFLVAFLLFFFYRIRKRRGRKYGGLRILGD